MEIATAADDRANPEIPWRQRPRLPLKVAAQIVGVSTATLYKMAGDGRLSFRRLAGKTVVDTRSLIAFIDSDEPWTPSARGTEARAALADRRRASWQR